MRTHTWTRSGGAGILVATLAVALAFPLAAQTGADADAAESLYREARSAMNAEDFAEAARLFAEVQELAAESAYAADALYFQAYALSRTDLQDDLQRARNLLARHARRFPGASNRADVEALRMRLQGRLALLGDADAYRAVEARAQGACDADDQEVRLMALSALRNMDPERAVPILQEVLRERDGCSAELRTHAVFLLSQHMTDETVGLLLELAHGNPDPDPEVREAAVFWLSQVGSEEAVGALVSILETSDDEELQERALFGLAEHGDERALDVLYGYAEREDVPERLREQAIFWLAQAPDGAERLVALYPRVQSDAAKQRILFAVAESGISDARAWLAERVRDASESTEVRTQAIFWLAEAGGDAGELRRIYSEVEDSELKRQAIFALSQIESDAAVDVLVDVARNESDPELRRQALRWLSEIDDPRVQDLLLEIIRGDDP